MCAVSILALLVPVFGPLFVRFLYHGMVITQSQWNKCMTCIELWSFWLDTCRQVACDQVVCEEIVCGTSCVWDKKEVCPKSWDTTLHGSSVPPLYRTATVAVDSHGTKRKKDRHSGKCTCKETGQKHAFV